MVQVMDTDLYSMMPGEPDETRRECLTNAEIACVRSQYHPCSTHAGALTAE
jgi:hypothetical protein